MHIRSVKITRLGHYGYTGETLDATKPFQCAVETESTDGKMELILSPALSQRVMEIVAEELAACAKETAESMVASVFSAPTYQRIEATPTPVALDDEIPF